MARVAAKHCAKMSEETLLVAQRKAENLFLLDTRGWCVVEDALSPAEVCALLSELQDATHLDTSTGKDGELIVKQSKADNTVRRWPFPYHYGPAFKALIDNPRITPLLQSRLGEEVKLDHEYVQTLKPNPDNNGRPSISGGIHGGPNHKLASERQDTESTVVRGEIHGGPSNHAPNSRNVIEGSGKRELLTVVYELLDVSPSDGGFGAVTGSVSSPFLFSCVFYGLMR